MTDSPGANRAGLGRVGVKLARLADGERGGRDELGEVGRANLGETGPLSQGAKDGRNALMILHLHCIYTV